MRRYMPVGLLLVVVTLSGCTTLRETQPTQTARQQLLLSTAADQASAQIAPNLPVGTRLYVDSSYFAEESEYMDFYAVNAIKRALLERGYALAPSPDDADTIVAISRGALSIDLKDRLFGLPGGNLPIPLAGSLSTPEVAFWKSHERTGIAKFVLTYYDAKTGLLQQASDPIYGFSHYNKSKILFYGRTRSNLLPESAKQQRKASIPKPSKE